MARGSSPSHRERGQFLVLFALASTVIILFAGLTIDGGYAFAQRRGSQNASDFAALAGARVIAEWVGGDTTNGTDANVEDAITKSIAANGASPITFGSPDGPIYIKTNGTPNGFVGSVPGGKKIPFGTVGVSLSTSRSWKPFFLGVIGINDWTASSTATAKGGSSAAGPPGDVFPAAISQATYETYPRCSGDIGSSAECQTVKLTPGSLNVPGGFGWLKFGAAGKCTGFGLGMIDDGCSTSETFLQDEIGLLTTAMAAARRSFSRVAPTRSAASRVTRSQPIAAPTSARTSPSRSRSGTWPVTRGANACHHVASRGWSSRVATAARTSMLSCVR